MRLLLTDLWANELAIVIKADPSHNEAKMKLAEIYEILNDPRKALDLVLQGTVSCSFPSQPLLIAILVIDSRRRPRATQDQGLQAAGDAAGSSLFEERPKTGKEKASKSAAQKASKLSVAQLKEMELKKEQEAVLSYGRVRNLWAAMLAGDAVAEREWMHEAESLVESFRETRALFLTTRVRPFLIPSILVLRLLKHPFVRA